MRQEEQSILLELERGIRAACVNGSVSEPIQNWAVALLTDLDRVRATPATPPAAGLDPGQRFGTRNVFTTKPERRAILEWALNECARVAQLPTRVDPAIYWEVAAPGIKLTPKELKEKSWCGGFGLCAVKSAGFGYMARWDFHGGGMGRNIYLTQDAEPANIAYFDQPNQHYALIEASNDEMLWLINGNSRGKGIDRNVVKRSSVSGIYSIERMLADPVPR